MKAISVALKAHLATRRTKLATCCLLTRTDGTIARITEHTKDIVIAGWVGAEAQFNGTYSSAVGFLKTTVQSTESMAVDNTELNGILASPSITEADLVAGVWDFAATELFRVNYGDLTQGRLSQRKGWLGEVSLKDRSSFLAELRGLMQAYSRTIGELTSPGCRASLGDARCKVDLGPFTVTGTLSGVTDDGLTLYDPARLEAGPTGGVVIAGVSNADPCVIEVTDTSTFTAGEHVTLSEIVGPDLLNVNWTILAIVDGTHFSINVDTTNTAIYPAYVSGGVVTPLGGDSGYFDFGTIEMTSGASSGLFADVLCYVPGQWQLQLPFGRGVAAGDDYEMIAGCDKSLSTCKDRFSNVLNMRAEPYLPGIDQIIQVQKSV